MLRLSQKSQCHVTRVANESIVTAFKAIVSERFNDLLSRDMSLCYAGNSPILARDEALDSVTCSFSPRVAFGKNRIWHFSPINWSLAASSER